MKKSASLLAFLFASAFLFSQNPNRVSLRGQVQDTTGEAIPMATVMLLTPADSQLVNFTQGDAQGFFEFKNVKNSRYLLKVSYVGYLPLQMVVEPGAASTHDLGAVKIRPITSELMEVVVRAAKATLSIRGDTIEYDASSFKVPPGSSVEDLLRRLPGIEVDADGNIRAQGRDVKRVYVDGKTFFGDDPKAATKNLGAETLSKVQVYGEASEQAKLTGVDDGKKEKAINLELKEEYKKGRFGKLTAAAGTEERLAGRGNLNQFNPKEQLSFIGYANNINQTGVNWDDYSEFKGQSSFSDFDNGDFGFSNGGGRRFIMGDDDGNGTPTNNFDGRGFTENFGGGSNYNFDNKKTKFNASYFYNQTDLDLDEFASTQTFLPDADFFRLDTLHQDDFRRNHQLNSRLEQEFDSTNTLILKGQSRLGFRGTESLSSQFFTDETGVASNRVGLSTDNELDTWRLNLTGIFRHRFKKRGRSFAVSGGWNDVKTDGPETVFSENRFFGDDAFLESRSQRNLRENRTFQGKSSLLYTEPLAKKWFSESFVNGSSSKSRVNRQVEDLQNDGQRVDDLSVFYDYRVQYGRAGSSVRYSNEGLNVSGGLAFQQLDLDGRFSMDEGLPLLAPPVERRFQNWTPNASLEYEIRRGTHLGGSYSYGVTEPKLTDLQPVPNVNNPTYVNLGNPSLGPELSHDFSVNFNRFNQANFSNIGIGGDLSLFENRIVQDLRTEFVDSLGFRTTSMPVNTSGGSRANIWWWSNRPIVKTKLTASLGGNFWRNVSPAFVNGVENETVSNNFTIRPGLTFTPRRTLILGLNAVLRFNAVAYSLDSGRDQEIRNHSLDGSLKWQFFGKFFLESNFNYSFYQNSRFGEAREIPIWNASVRRLLGKANRFELRLAAFDLLDRKRYIQQSGWQNYVVNREAATLARYFMLSLSYNFKGYEAKLKKGNEWF